MKTTYRMNKILTATVTMMAIASANGAYAASEPIVSGSWRPIYSALETQTTRSAPTSALDFRFELTGQPRQNGGIGKMHQADSESLVFVRLVRPGDGAPLTDADVTLSRVDMARDRMGAMTARSYIRPYGDPGTYRVEIHPAMAGRWAVTVATRVAGESEPVRQTLTVALAK
jgi:YtkA-like